MNTTMSNELSAAALFADVKTSPERRREAMLILAQRGLENLEKFGASIAWQRETIAEYSTFDLATGAATIGNAVRREDGRIKDLRDRMSAHARAATTLTTLAEADGASEPEFAELRARCAAVGAEFAELKILWAAERERLLRLAGLHGELHTVRYCEGVEWLRQVLAGEAPVSPAEG
jgi:hypothetical protein